MYIWILKILVLVIHTYTYVVCTKMCPKAALDGLQKQTNNKNDTSLRITSEQRY